MTRRTITTGETCPPIPIRNHDWFAHWGDYDLDDAIATGATEAEAIINLVEMTAEQLPEGE